METKTKKKRTRGKADSAEIEKRVNSVYLMLIQGYQRKHILQYCAQNFQVKPRQTDTYITKARKIMSEDQEVDRKIKTNEILSQHYYLYQRCLKEEDYKECRAILREISEILGVKAAAKLDLDHTTAGKPMQEEIDYTKLSQRTLEEIASLREDDEPL